MQWTLKKQNDIFSMLLYFIFGCCPLRRTKTNGWLLLVIELAEAPHCGHDRAHLQASTADLREVICGSGGLLDLSCLLAAPKLPVVNRFPSSGGTTMAAFSKYGLFLLCLDGVSAESR